MFQRLFLLLFAVLLLAPPAQAAYPDRPIKLIVAVGPGGFVDLVTRQVAAMLGQELGQPVLVSNMPGGGGNTALNTLLTSPADGYTLAVTPSGALDYNPAVLKNVRYTMNDFTILSSLADQRLAVFTMPDKPWKSLKEAFAWAKKENRPLSVAVPGTEAVGCIEEVARAEGWKVSPIPQQGGAAVLTAVLGGHADIGMAATVIVESALAGKILPLATAAEKRIGMMGDVPTLRELGYNASTETITVLLAPKGLPDEVRTRLEEAMLKLGNSQEYRNEVYTRFHVDESPKDSEGVRKHLEINLARNKALYVPQ